MNTRPAEAALRHHAKMHVRLALQAERIVLQLLASGVVELNTKRVMMLELQ